MWFQPIQWVGGSLLVAMVEERYYGAAGWCYFHASWLFSLWSTQGPPQWILSHFRQAAPLIDLCCCLQGLEQTSKATVWFHLPVRRIPTSGASLPDERTRPHLLPQPSLMIFQRRIQGLVALCAIVREPPTRALHPHLPCLSLYADISLMCRWRVVWFRQHKART